MSDTLLFKKLISLDTYGYAIGYSKYEHRLYVKCILHRLIYIGEPE